MPANEMLKVIREKSELLEIDRKFCPAQTKVFQVERRNVMKFSNGYVRAKIGNS
jgi:hypothetical protein